MKMIESKTWKDITVGKRENAGSFQNCYQQIIRLQMIYI